MEDARGKRKYFVQRTLYAMPETKEKDLSLLDRTDKSFMIIYLLIFIFSIILTIISI